MKNIINYIDEIIVAIKKKGDISGYNYCDARVILSLEIARLEIASQGKLSDLTIQALTEIKSMDARQNYLNIHQEIFDQINFLMLKMQKIESRFIIDPPGIIGFSTPNWQNYYTEVIKNLFAGIHKKANL